MNSTDSRNRKIIDAVIRKEQAVCPGTVALIGIYGSFRTGDVHPLSDLDLLILISDDRGISDIDGGKGSGGFPVQDRRESGRIRPMPAAA